MYLFTAHKNQLIEIHHFLKAKKEQFMILQLILANSYSYRLIYLNDLLSFQMGG